MTSATPAPAHRQDRGILSVHRSPTTPPKKTTDAQTCTAGDAATRTGPSDSRLYLNSHWLTDVLGGVTGGMAYLLFALTWLAGWRDPTRPLSADADLRHDAAPEPRSPPPSREGLSNADPSRTVSGINWPNRASAMLPFAREHLLTAFFMALAVSVSAVQILQTVLLVLMPSWRGAGRAGGVRAGGGATWTEFAPLRRHPLTRPFLLLTALTVLSAATSGNPGWSLWIARDVLRITVFYLVLWYVRDGDHAHRVWSGFLVTLSLMAGYGLSQAWLCRVQPSAVPGAWLAAICTNPDRVRGPFSIYMTFGDVLMLGALFFLAYLANVPARPVWWMAVAAPVTISSLAATYARHAWIGLATGLLILIPTSRRRVGIGLALLLVAVPGTIMVPQTIRHRIQSIIDLHDVTIRDRLAMWHSGLLMIYDHPLLGVGPGQVRAWYPAYRRPEAVRPSTGHLHSSPIHLAAERGLPALAIWAWIWVVFFREGGRIWRQLGRDRLRERALVCASLSGVAAFLASGLFQHTFGDAAVVMLVYALMALPFSVERRHSMLDPAGDSPPGAGAPRRPSTLP